MENKDNKWIGFDMDECLGHFSTLSVFPQIQTMLELHRIPRYTREEFNTIFTKRIVEKIAKYEITGITCLLRPGIIDSLRHINTPNVFILSNNSSFLLIEWVANIINKLAQKEIFTRNMLFNLHHIYRIDSAKNMTAVIMCTGAIPEKLLFFDDLYHELANEQDVTYIKVEPYTYKTPLVPIAKAFLEVLDESADIIDIYGAKEQLTWLSSYEEFLKSSIISWSEDCKTDPNLFAHLNMDAAYNAPIIDTTTLIIGREIIDFLSSTDT